MLKASQPRSCARFVGTGRGHVLSGTARIARDVDSFRVLVLDCSTLSTDGRSADSRGFADTDEAGEKERRGFLPPSSSLRFGISPRRDAGQSSHQSRAPIGCDEACARHACGP